MQVDVMPADHRLTVSYIEDERLVLLQGENKSTRIWLMNAGSCPISEVWMVCGPDDEIWMGSDDLLEDCKPDPIDFIKFRLTTALQVQSKLKSFNLRIR